MNTSKMSACFFMHAFYAHAYTMHITLTHIPCIRTTEQAVRAGHCHGHGHGHGAYIQTEMTRPKSYCRRPLLPLHPACCRCRGRKALSTGLPLVGPLLPLLWAVLGVHALRTFLDLGSEEVSSEAYVANQSVHPRIPMRPDLQNHAVVSVSSSRAHSCRVQSRVRKYSNT
jgi:hypothetical protein